MTGRLDALLSRATVRIGPAGEPDRLWGSGFFVAPDWVLTCAHVLAPAGGPEHAADLLLQGHQRVRARARTAYWLGGGTDPEQDLALLRVTDPIDHTCVRLTDRYDPPIAVTAHGWRPVSAGAPQRWSGQTECNGRDGAYGLTLAPHVEIPHGASGGPLLDRERGLVAGVVKARRAQKDGGLAVAVTALRGFRRAVPVDGESALGPDPYAALIRAHDLWHEQTDGALSWVDAQAELCAGAERRWDPRDSARAAALLAELPRPASPAQLQTLIERVLGDEPLWEDEHAPHDWRDGHGWLYDHREGADVVSLHYLRAVAAACADRAPEAVADLERWVERRAARLPRHLRALLRTAAPVRPPDHRRPPDHPAHGAPQGRDHPPVASGGPDTGPRGHRAPCAPAAPAPAAAAVGVGREPDDEGPVVAVELEPDLFRPHDRFHWRIWAWTGGADTVRTVDQDTDGEGASLAELPYLLNEPLTRTFGRLDGHRRARLELALPVEHFGVNVHLWRPGPVVSSLKPHPAERPFGVHRQVVLRCLKRRGEPTEMWRERWHGVAENAPKALAVQSDAAARALAEAPPGAVPVLCRPPAESTTTLTQALGAGYGVILWHLRAEHTHGCGPDCDRLHEKAAELLATTGRATALPEHLRALRERVSNADPQAYWAEDLALLYDDPRRPIPLCDDLLESP